MWGGGGVGGVGGTGNQQISLFKILSLCRMTEF